MSDGILIDRRTLLVEFDYPRVIIIRQNPGERTVGNMVPKTPVIRILEVVEIKRGSVVEIRGIEIEKAFALPVVPS